VGSAFQGEARKSLKLQVRVAVILRRMTLHKIDAVGFGDLCESYEMAMEVGMRIVLRGWVFAVILAWVMAGLAAGQNPAKFLTNDDVMAMVKAGQSADAILNAFQNHGTDFDVSPEALLKLKKSGVPQKVIDGMTAAVKQQQDAAAAMLSTAQARNAAEEAEEKAEADKVEAARAAQAAALSSLATARPGEPSVAMLEGTEKQALVVSHTQIVPINSSLLQGSPSQMSSLDLLATDGALTAALTSMGQMMDKANTMMPGSGKTSMTLTSNPLVAPAMMAASLFSKYRAASTQMIDVWAIPGLKSGAVAQESRPTLLVQFDGFLGVNVGEYEPILVKLPLSPSSFRLVGAAMAKGSDMQSSTADWSMYASFLERKMAVQLTKVATGRYLLQPSDGLLPGEYGIVLRPVNKEKKFSGSNVSQNLGEGLVFNCVWSFEVP